MPHARPLMPDAVVFGWGAGVFACTDKTWEEILTCVRDCKGWGLEDIVQRKATRLSDRAFIHLGTLTPAEAETRLSGRKKALSGDPDETPVVRQRFEPPRRRSG